VRVQLGARGRGDIAWGEVTSVGRDVVSKRLLSQLVKVE
jgi:hypothetical protein